MMIRNRPYVALLLRCSAKTYRESLNGFLRFNNCAEPWSLLMVQEREANEKRIGFDPKKLSGLVIDDTIEDYKHLNRFGSTPMITIEATRPKKIANPRRLSLFCDNEAIGRFGAQHLKKLGYTHFAYVPDMLSQLWSRLRGKGFADELKSAGFTCPTFTPPKPDDPKLAAKDHEELATWLAALPKPCAVFSANDLRARDVLDAAREAGISIPRELVLLGCDDEEIFCETTAPTISSIRFNIEEAAFNAARILDRMIREGITLDEQERFFGYGPAVVVSRKSTARLTVDDPLVEKALEYIYINAVNGISVNEIADELGISRRTLENRFRATLGRSPYDEALRYRLDLASRMLRDGSMSTEEIATRCGFPDPSHFQTMFKRKLGLTPAQYRNRPGVQ